MNSLNPWNLDEASTDVKMLAMFGSFKVSLPEQTRTIYSDSRVGRVDVADNENIEKWARVLGISEAELLSNVEEFGSLVTDIRKGRKSKS